MRACARAVPIMLLAGALLVGCTEPGSQKDSAKGPAITDDMYVVKVDGMT